ncbi:MAG TPA: hypothetical protein VKU44_03195 [Terriglobia bacterium]|nr:hypothetical protein [Terriglobia bacterium]
MRRRIWCALAGALLLTSLVIAALAADVVHLEIIPNLPASPTINANTVPANGDVNPYGVAFVPSGFPSGGPLHPGDVAVSNFNDMGNAQGTGSTIVGIDPAGNQSLFFQASTMLGLTTALGVLQRGFVLVGSLPSSGTCTQSGDQELGVGQGSLLILDHTGNVVQNLSNAALLDGPWDLTVQDQGEFAQVFVSNALSGTVTRLDLKIPKSGIGVIVQSMTQIASGYTHLCNTSALVVGPTGLAFDSVRNILYVASTGDNAVYVIPGAGTRSTDAGTGTLVYQDSFHLHGPLGLALAPNGDLISSQGDAVNPDPTQPSELVEFTPGGQFIAQVPIDSSGMEGGAFGLAIELTAKGIRFAAVDDISNTLEVWNLK